MSLFIMLLEVVLLGSLAVVIYKFVEYIKSNRAIEKSVARIYIKADERYSKRKEEKERTYLNEGNTENTSKIYQFDLMIERSGLRKKFPRLTTETYLGITSLLSIIVLLIGNLLGGFLIGAVFVIVTIMVSYAIVYILSGRTYKKIDDEIISFVNLLENYATSDSDIVKIMGDVYPYLNEPLRDYIEEFYTEATTTGNQERAFMNLENKIENRRLKSVFRNLEICSRNDANYDVIIKDERRSLRAYSKSKEKVNQLTRSGRSDIIFLLLMGSVLISMFASFVPNLSYNLLNTGVGNIILLYCILVIGNCVISFITLDKGEKM